MKWFDKLLGFFIERLDFDSYYFVRFSLLDYEGTRKLASKLGTVLLCKVLLFANNHQINEFMSTIKPRDAIRIRHKLGLPAGRNTVQCENDVYYALRGQMSTALFGEVKFLKSKCKQDYFLQACRSVGNSDKVTFMQAAKYLMGAVDDHSYFDFFKGIYFKLPANEFMPIFELICKVAYGSDVVNAPAKAREIVEKISSDFAQFH